MMGDMVSWRYNAAPSNRKHTSKKDNGRLLGQSSFSVWSNEGLSESHHLRQSSLHFAESERFVLLDLYEIAEVGAEVDEIKGFQARLT